LVRAADFFNLEAQAVRRHRNQKIPPRQRCAKLYHTPASSRTRV
jgi:hypothetical protein